MMEQMHLPPKAKVSAFEREHPAASALLRRLLEPDEKVKLITTGWRSWFVDDVFFGFPTILANRTLIIGTERRLLLIHTSRAGLRPEGYVNEVPRDSVIGSIGLPLLSLFTSAGTVRFLGVPFAGKRALDFEHDPAAKPTATPRALCPACFAPQPVGIAACGECGVGLKTPGSAAWRSLLLPGWGDAYLDSLPLGMLTAAVTMFLWLNVLAFMRAAESAGPGQIEAVQRMEVGFLAMAGCAHVLAAAVAWGRAQHGLRAKSGELPARR